MAEPLRTLFSRIRRPRPARQMRWEPVSVQGGTSPGMRGSINPLDSVAITDSAQGVDISSIAPPTRLMAGRADEAYAQPQETAPQSPFMFASQREGTPVQSVSQGGVRYEKRCNGGACQMVPVFDDPGMMSQPVMQQPAAQQLPPGVSLNPGETYVPGSLRETSSPPMMASASPALASPQPMAPAAPVPQEQPGPASTVRQGMTQDEVMRAFDPAIQAFRSARTEPTARGAVLARDEATAMFNAAGRAVAAMQAAELNARSAELEKILIQRGQRELDLKDPEVQQRKYQQTIADIRSQTNLPIADRARAIVEYKVRQSPNMQFTPEAATAAVNEEEQTIFSMDAARYYKLSLDAGTKAGKATDDRERATRQMQRLHLEGMLVSSVNNQFQKIQDPTLLRQSIDASLRQPMYYSAFEHLKSTGMPEADAEAAASTLADRAVNHVYGRVTSVRAGGPLYLAPQADQQPASPQPQEPPAPQASTQPKSSGTGWLESLSSGPW